MKTIPVMLVLVLAMSVVALGKTILEFEAKESPRMEESQVETSPNMEESEVEDSPSMEESQIEESPSMEEGKVLDPPADVGCHHCCHWKNPCHNYHHYYHHHYYHHYCHHHYYHHHYHHHYYHHYCHHHYYHHYYHHHYYHHYCHHHYYHHHYYCHHHYNESSCFCLGDQCHCYTNIGSLKNQTFSFSVSKKREGDLSGPQKFIFTATAWPSNKRIFEAEIAEGDSGVKCGSFGYQRVCAKVSDLQATLSEGFNGCIVQTEPGSREVKLGCFKRSENDESMPDFMETNESHANEE